MVSSLFRQIRSDLCRLSSWTRNGILELDEEDGLKELGNTDRRQMNREMQGVFQSALFVGQCPSVSCRVSWTSQPFGHSECSISSLEQPCCKTPAPLRGRRCPFFLGPSMYLHPFSHPLPGTMYMPSTSLFRLETSSPRNESRFTSERAFFRFL